MPKAYYQIIVKVFLKSRGEKSMLKMFTHYEVNRKKDWKKNKWISCCSQIVYFGKTKIRHN